MSSPIRLFMRTNSFRIMIVCSIFAAVIYSSLTIGSTTSAIETKEEDLKGVRSSNSDDVSSVEEKNSINSNKEGSSIFSMEDVCMGPVSLKPESEVDSIFNCGSKSGLCHYYYPAKFFSDCGAGRDFVYLVNETETKRLNGTLWSNMPSIGFPTLSMEDKNISFVHVHKAGGTSLHSAFNYNMRKKHSRLTRHHWYFPRGGPDKKHSKAGKGPSPVVNSSPYEKAKADVQHVVRYPATFGKDDHIMMAVIRDPAERFISSIGQAMGAPGSQSNGIAQQFQAECIKNTTQDTLRCCIDYVERHTFWVEIHFTPQSLEVSFATLWQDIPISLFDFKDLGVILSDLGADPNSKKRDGHKHGYRKDEILANLSKNDYDEDMLRKVCNLYKVDVLMRRVAGLPKANCDRFIE